ncbi:MAG TPA: LysR family transcriptional regulator [Thermoanaerobaculia bacterium]|nr:LysR family transcriptional regulator [Thermoanaerobaculia bacterium]
MSMLDIRHLRLLLAVAEEGTLTRAASRLHVTQSALSHQLREAERSVGRPLFVRGPRRMALTAAGDRLLRSARTVLEELGSAELEIGGLREESEGTLRLATECYTCYHWLPSALATFGKSHPRVDVQIVAEATRRPLPALLEGALDVAIVSAGVRNSKLRLTPLFRDEMVVVLPAGHRLAAARVVSALDFAPETLITYAAPRENLTVFREVLAPAGVSPRRWIPIEITEAIVELVKAGQGVSVMARWAAEPYAAGGKLVLRRLTEKGISRVWNAAIRRQKSAPKYLADFVDALLGATGRPRGILASATAGAAAARPAEGRRRAV